MPKSQQDKLRLKSLLAEGEEFTYQTFSSKGQYGYPSAYTPEWVAWTARVKSIIFRLFGESSAPYEMLKLGLDVRLIGNGEDKFEQALSYFVGALLASIDILDDDRFEELGPGVVAAGGVRSNRVFVVHGHDEKSKTALEILLSELGLEPVVLHRQPDEGRTVIEKFEKYSDVGYAFILLTPDDISYPAKQEALPDTERIKEFRARQNVILELGYFVGKLGRSNVCCLYTGNVTLPSDIHGLLYKKYSESVDEVAYPITKELKARGYRLK